MGLFGKKKNKRTAVTALIGNSTYVDRDFLSFSGGIHIDGHVGLDVVGREESGTAISILENGEVDGDVSAVDVFVAGVIHGNVYASGNLQLMSTARIRGDVHYASLVIADGAIIQGDARKL
ncbi:MAG: bactofilin family protein [Woeseiaceae bacterium]